MGSAGVALSLVFVYEGVHAPGSHPIPRLLSPSQFMSPCSPRVIRLPPPFRPSPFNSSCAQQLMCPARFPTPGFPHPHKVCPPTLLPFSGFSRPAPSAQALSASSSVTTVVVEPASSGRGASGSGARGTGLPGNGNPMGEEIDSKAYLEDIINLSVDLDPYDDSDDENVGVGRMWGESVAEGAGEGGGYKGGGKRVAGRLPAA